MIRILVAAFAVCSLSLAAQAGSITGTIKFEGNAPTMKPIDMKADPVCHSKHTDEPQLNEVLVLGEGQTMANVFVEVIEGLPDKEWPMPEEPFILTQAGCMYSPRVFGVRVGQTLKVLNPDGTIHNVNGLAIVNKPFNKGMPKSLEQIEMTFTEPESFLQFRCDVHNWMRAFCSVMTHPFFDTTETDGTFEIADLPAGEYTIRATHEKLGEQTAKVTVTDDKPAEANFAFARP